MDKMSSNESQINASVQMDADDFYDEASDDSDDGIKIAPTRLKFKFAKEIRKIISGTFKFLSLKIIQLVADSLSEADSAELLGITNCEDEISYFFIVPQQI